jgi:predicted ferric reductase
MPAVIRGPFGRFSHQKGTRRQVWIAGGIGVTPFLSWMRAIDEQPPRGPVDFFYTCAGPDIPYTDEINAIAADCDLIHAHIVDSRDRHLTADQVLASTNGEKPGTLSVFMCGPLGMARNFRADFRRAGVRARNIYREDFDWR